MKKGIFLLISFLTACLSYTQEVIEMENYGGVYRIPCAINGAGMKMIFDTGATEVSLSSSAADYLLRNGYLAKEDFLGFKDYRIADGSTGKSWGVILRDVAIGNVHIKNIQASIIANQDAPLLLGQSVIQCLGSITIDGNRLIINKTHFSETDIEKLGQDTKSYIRNGNYSAAYNNLLKINQVGGLTADQMLELAACLYHMELYADCLGACSQWIRNYDTVNNSNQADIYLLVAGSFFMLKEYRDAVEWYNKVISRTSTNDGNLPLFKNCIAQCYYEVGDIRNAIANVRWAISAYRRQLQVAIQEIQRGNVQDDSLGSMFQLYAACFFKMGQTKPGLQMLTISAKCGDEAARQFCQKHHIHY